MSGNPSVGLAPLHEGRKEAAIIRSRSRFFLTLSAVMLGAMFVGFSRTYYFRSLLGTPDVTGAPGLPWHLHLHGLVMSAWFVLVFAQTWLIQGHRIAIHRRLGIVGGGLALTVVVVGIFVLVRFVSRAGEVGRDLAEVRPIVIGDILALTLFFPALVGAGLWLRRQPESHKRLMLLSCLMLWPPILARYAGTFATLGWLPSAGRALTPQIMVGGLSLLVLTEFTWLIGLIAYDN